MSDVPVSKPSDLKVRVLSAIVMVAIAGLAFWFGGVWLRLFIGAVAFVAFVEFVGLVLKATPRFHFRLAALLAGMVYIGSAAAYLVGIGSEVVFQVVGTVIAVDVFAYFTGRKFGGPKIAPKISPSKTWSGLIGGAIGAAMFLVAMGLVHNAFYGTQLCRSYYDFVDSLESPMSGGWTFDDRCHIALHSFDLLSLTFTFLTGAVMAVVAQSGDFLESWMKRRAGVKDSSNIIPGHGGVFDRTDGLIAVAFVFGILMLFAGLMER